MSSVLNVLYIPSVYQFCPKPAEYKQGWEVDKELNRIFVLALLWLGRDLLVFCGWNCLLVSVSTVVQSSTEPYVSNRHIYQVEAMYVQLLWQYPKHSPISITEQSFYKEIPSLWNTPATAFLITVLVNNILSLHSLLVCPAETRRDC